jgi:hypothetical protein
LILRGARPRRAIGLAASDDGEARERQRASSLVRGRSSRG